ncbi:MAG TPA: L,D-transpeptidase [Symbiobacteriaceae bacterium]
MARYRIDIKKRANTLSLYADGKLQKVYPVGTGRERSITPEGTFHIVFKTWFASWTNPATGETIPGGSARNPLGTRWLGFDANGTTGRSYGIHGTNRPESVGSYITSGCVRMYNRDVEELYNLVDMGTEVKIEW